VVAENWTRGSYAQRERLAIDVYRHAEETGPQITLGFVERRLDELRSHETSLSMQAMYCSARGASTWGFLRCTAVGRRDRGDEAAGGALERRHARRADWLNLPVARRKELGLRGH
jgi:hypothetical protein